MYAPHCVRSRYPRQCVFDGNRHCVFDAHLGGRPSAVVVVGHDVDPVDGVDDVVQVVADLEDPGAGGRGDGDQVGLLAFQLLLETGQFFAQSPQELDVVVAVGGGAVDGAARHRILPVDVDAVKVVLGHDQLHVADEVGLHLFGGDAVAKVLRVLPAADGEEGAQAVRVALDAAEHLEPLQRLLAVGLQVLRVGRVGAAHGQRAVGAHLDESVDDVRQVTGLRLRQQRVAPRRHVGHHLLAAARRQAAGAQRRRSAGVRRRFRFLVVDGGGGVLVVGVGVLDALGREASRAAEPTLDLHLQPVPCHGLVFVRYTISFLIATPDDRRCRTKFYRPSFYQSSIQVVIASNEMQVQA